MTKKSANQNPQKPAGEPTVEGWMFLAVSSVDNGLPVISARGVVKSRIGPAYMLHFITPVQYALLVDIQDMQDILLFPAGEAASEFLQYHASMGGRDMSLRPKLAANDPEEFQGVPGGVDIPEGVPVDAEVDS